jgi:ribosomal-protein-alanine N-acetyltransferase
LTHELVSERLTLRPVGDDDVETLHAIWTEEPVRRFLWDGEVIPFERTRDIVRRSRALFEEKDFGIWGVRERSLDELVGFAGFWYFRSPPWLELLFGVAPNHWGRGVATEVSRRLLGYAFDDLGFDAVDASTDAGNVASVRVMEKAGMHFRRRAIVDGLDTLFYRCERETT